MKQEETTVGLVGYNGHFGKVIGERLILDFPRIVFLLLGRREPVVQHGNCSFQSFDYEIDTSIPYGEHKPFVILDLTGPVKSDDGKLLELCAKAGIPYMDMAVHNSHLEIVEGVRERYPDCTVFAHFGFFPGLSNLIITEGFRLLQRKAVVLANEFPVYAGGGKNVSRSLVDLMDESANQKNLKNGKAFFFRMHSRKQIIRWHKKYKTFYHWEYPEINSILRSNGDTESLERLFVIKPNLFNPLFSATVRMWNTPLRYLLKSILPAMAYSFKSTLLSKMDPGVEMKLMNEEGEIIIHLRVKSAVSFHGEVMSAFLKSLLSERMEPGLYTPEQLFFLREIIPEGEQDTFTLHIAESRKSS